MTGIYQIITQIINTDQETTKHRENDFSKPVYVQGLNSNDPPLWSSPLAIWLMPAPLNPIPSPKLTLLQQLYVNTFMFWIYINTHCSYWISTCQKKKKSFIYLFIYKPRIIHLVLYLENPMRRQRDHTDTKNICYSEIRQWTLLFNLKPYFQVRLLTQV